MARNRFDVDENLESPFNINHLKRSFVYLKRHTNAMVLSLTLSALSAVCALFGLKILQYAVDYTVPNKDYKQLMLLVVMMAAVICVSIGFAWKRSKTMTVVSQEIVFDIRQDLFEHLQKLSFQYYDERPHGKILVRIIHYVNNVSDMLSNGIINLILEIFNVIVIMFFMFATDVRLTLVVLSGLPVFLFIVLVIQPKQRRAWQEVSNKSSNMNAYIQECIDGAKIVQSFTREEENVKTFESLNMASMKTYMKAVYLSHTIWVSVDNIAVIVVALMYMVGVAWTAQTVSLGVLMAMGSYAWSFWQPILNLSNLYNNFINAISYLERIFETMDEPVTVDDKEDAYELPAITGQVTFDDVTFSYDDTVNILEHVSFDVKAGESIALVGPTGAGKTTVVNLISRFYNLTGGAVRIDGHDISDVTLHSLRSQMGIMLQDSFIFSGTIKDNILYGRLDATDEEIEKACKTVCADQFIREFEDGYDTEVSERGNRLSQGQKQLISFARTLLADPKILILDEATSSIDVKTEKLLQEGLQNLLKGRTSFIIAHRLSTIRNCDKIMFVNNKGIMECGSHDELMAKKGDYYRLYTAQMDN